MQQHFIFLTKDDTVIPQSLEEHDAGEIIRSLLLQSFHVSPLHLMARDSREAIKKHDIIIKYHCK